MAAWRQTVETRHSELRGDVRKLDRKVDTGFNSVHNRQEQDFRIIFGALIAVALGLAGLMAKGFHWIG